MLPPSTQPRSRLRRIYERFNIEVHIRGAVELADELQGALFIGGDAIGAGLEMLIVGDKSVPPVVEVFIKREMNRSCDSKGVSGSLWKICQPGRVWKPTLLEDGSDGSAEWG